MEPAIALFDLDSVLVYPGGYQTAFFQTIRYLLQAIDIEYLLPGEEIFDLFEAHSVTSEWDKIPITLAIILEAVYQNNPQLAVPLNFNEAIQEIKAAHLNQVSIDFSGVITTIAHAFNQADIPSLGLLYAIENHHLPAPFSQWKSAHLLRDLLQTTRDVHRSYPNRLFQNFVLGSKRFQEVYHLPIEVDSESLMLLNDRVLISPDARDCLSQLYKKDVLRIAALTFRPSLPPREVLVLEKGYSPEAEMALSRLQLNSIPLIGYGRISYLAQQIHTTPDTLIKPSPVQALAGIAAAWLRNEWQALTWAYEIYRHPSHENSKFMPTSFQCHVFEDSTLGIISSRSAVEILEKCGYHIDMHTWGISSNHRKTRSLEAAGVSVFPDVNVAISKLKDYFPDEDLQ
ncbi:MAG: hypothetical protein JW908_11755 [Anaerolineales bacterium]|nr:hypothetical protein [Anaerolineales bacterium]